MIIYLSRLPDTLRGPDDEGYGGRFPKRASMLHPEAARSLLRLEEASGGLVYTDAYRSPEAQRDAHRRKGGTQPVGFSAHGYGLAVDLDVGGTLRRSSVRRYPQLVDLMGEHGWYCHRRDLDPTAGESWHFNYLGPQAEQHLAKADPQRHSTWALPAESRIQELYGDGFKLSSAGVSAALTAGSYPGVEAFQRDWDLKVDGVAGPVTQRVLAYVTATVAFVAAA